MASPRAGIAPPDFSNLKQPLTPSRERLAPVDAPPDAANAPVGSPAATRRATPRSVPSGSPLAELYPEMAVGKRERTTHCSLRLPVSMADALDELVKAGAPSVNALAVSFIGKCLRELKTAS